MNKVGLPPGSWRKPQPGLLTLTATALITGAGTGVPGAAFRASLETADRWRNIMIASAHASAFTGFLLVVGACAAATLISAWLVRGFSPEASGSGIPHVEAVLRDGIPPASYRLPQVKFVGGDLAIGVGLALGPEGPAEQLGASIAVLVGRAFRLSWPEIFGRSWPRARAPALRPPSTRRSPAAPSCWRNCSRASTGALRSPPSRRPRRRSRSRARTWAIRSSYDVPSLPNVAAEARPLFFLLGAVMGLVAVSYNRTVLATLAAFERLPLPVEARAGLIGAAVGVLAWVSPGLVGGGDSITRDALRGGPALQLVALAFLVRFGLVAVSNAAGAPGRPVRAAVGVRGAIWPHVRLGVPLGHPLAQRSARVFRPRPYGGSLRGGRAGAADLVGARQRNDRERHAPVADAACAMAMLVPTLLRDPPIYDSLREALLRRGRVAGLAKPAIKADADDASLVSPAGRELRS